jgi:phosphomevalonate kinase
MSATRITRSFTPVPGPPGPTVEVPGKLFLAGEYAVLDGAPAVVAAAGRTARAAFLPGLVPASAVVAVAVERARAALATRGLTLPVGAVRVDTSAFQHEGVKLGLGSSAAAAVASVAASFESVGLPIADESALLLAVADGAHRAAQGGVGSGGDIAAAVLGGFLRYVRTPAGTVAWTPLTLPVGLHLVPFWTRAAARTTDFISGVRRFAQEKPAEHARRMGDLSAAAVAFADAFAADAHRTVTAAATYGEALAALGVDAALPIVVPAVAAAAALASHLGGAAKPSGAGGGDMGIAFFASEAAAQTFAARCPEGVLVLDISLGVGGACTKIFKKD